MSLEYYFRSNFFHFLYNCLCSALGLLRCCFRNFLVILAPGEPDLGLGIRFARFPPEPPPPLSMTCLLKSRLSGRKIRLCTSSLARIFAFHC